jgi:hypothetical protein
MQSYWSNGAGNDLIKNGPFDLNSLPSGGDSEARRGSGHINAKNGKVK